MPPNNPTPGPQPPLNPGATPPAGGAVPPQPNAAVPPVVPTGVPSAEAITEYSPAAFSQAPADPTFGLGSVVNQDTSAAPSESPYPVQASLPGNPGGPPPPPPPPQMPFFLDPRSPYARIGQAPPPPKGRKMAKAILVVVVLLILGVAGFIFLQAQGSGSGSDELFQSALANSLATNNLTQKTTIDQDSIELKQDVSDNKNPKLSGTIDLKSLSAQLEGYATLANSYVKYDSVGNFKTSTTTADDLLTGKWVQIRNNNKLPTQYAPETALEGLFDPRMSIYGGSMVFGNFTPSDQQALLGDLQSSGVYSFDPESVQATTVNGQAAMQYAVTVNAAALKAFNKKAGQMAGIAAADLDDAIEAANFDDYAKAKITWFISTDSQRLVKITAVDNGQTVTTEYSDYGNTVVAAEPQADYQYTDFQTLLKGRATPALTGQAEDTERNSDVLSIATYLEKYYDTYKFYPSLINMNDANWVTANLTGIPDATLRDPKGTTNQFAASPTVNQYSYQVYKDKSLGACEGISCQHFKVSATYSNGAVFSKESVR